MMMRVAWFVLLVLAAVQLCTPNQDTCSNGDCAREDDREPEVAKAAQKEKAFFDTYADPSAHAKMVLDKPRTNAYRDAMEKNPELFRGATVIDVGCGSGVLSLFAAKAGAAQVFCIEFTDIAKVATEMVYANGMENIITVIQSRIEDADLPIPNGGADIIVSEWMGYFGLFEGMFQSVLWARNKYLKPDGHMLPNNIKLFIATADKKKISPKAKKYKKWEKPLFGLNFAPMKPVLASWDDFQADAQLNGWRSSTYPEIAHMDPKQLVSKPVMIAELDMQTAQKSDFEKISVDFTLRAPRDRGIDRMVGWFECDFSRGPVPITLDTGPTAEKTHWLQMIFHLDKYREVKRGSTIMGRIDITTHGDYDREMNVKLLYKMSDEEITNRKDYTVVIVPDTTNWSN